MEQMMNARRIKVLVVDPMEVAHLLAQNRTVKFESKLPADAKCVSADKDISRDRFLLFYESEEFDLVKEGKPVPELPWDTVMIYEEEQ